MNTETFSVALSLTMAALSFGTLALGLRVASGKPFLLRSGIYLAVIVLMFVLPLAASFVGIWPPDWQSVLFALLGLVLVIPVVIFGMRRSIGDLVVYNTTATIVRQALEETLNEHNLPYSEGDRPGLLSRASATLNALTKFSLALKDLNCSIQVTISPLGIATLRFTKKQAIPDYQGLIASLGDELRATQFEGNRFNGSLMLVGSVVMMGLSIWLLLS